MAGNENEQRVMGHGLTDGLGTSSDGSGQFTISACLSMRNGTQGGPDTLLIGRSAEHQRNGLEVYSFTIEIILHHVPYFQQEWCLTLVPAPAFIEGNDLSLFFTEGQGTEGRMERKLWHENKAARFAGGRQFFLQAAAFPA